MGINASSYEISAELKSVLEDAKIISKTMSTSFSQVGMGTYRMSHADYEAIQEKLSEMNIKKEEQINSLENRIEKTQRVLKVCESAAKKLVTFAQRAHENYLRLSETVATHELAKGNYVYALDEKAVADFMMEKIPEARDKDLTAELEAFVSQAQTHDDAAGTSERTNGQTKDYDFDFDNENNDLSMED